MKESIDYNEFLKELKEQYGRCEKLFNIAWISIITKTPNMT